MAGFQVSSQLLSSGSMVAVAAPDLQFHHGTFAEVIDDYVHAFLITGLCFDVIIAGTVDHRTEKEQEPVLSRSLIWADSPDLISGVMMGLFYDFMCCGCRSDRNV